ncbi:hypothetical protein PIB30_024270 [Stylosanthes scabra]|uniref:Uncharacterized protein n=1 Tax=Stylosanthes scabra TaxID=79078 RepID=A0ABU6VB69_9FABA|nr:hypothetical protein [Stylosanthes scabra]
MTKKDNLDEMGNDSKKEMIAATASAKKDNIFRPKGSRHQFRRISILAFYKAHLMPLGEKLTTCHQQWVNNKVFFQNSQEVQK